MVEVDSRVVGMKGTLKRLFVREHKTEIMLYYHKNGPEATKQRFAMGQPLFDEFLGGKIIDPYNMTEEKRALEIARTAAETSLCTNVCTKLLVCKSVRSPCLSFACSFSNISWRIILRPILYVQG